MNNKIDTEQLKDYIPIADVVNRLGLKLNRQLQGDCPTGHESNGHKCFSINDKKNYYHCFHCNKSGDIISLVGLVLNKDFLQSVDWLKENFGYGDSKKMKRPTPKQEEITQDLIEKDALYELVYKYGKELLYSDTGREALNYLTLVRQYDYESLKKTDWIYFPRDSEIRKHLLSIHPESSKQISKLSLQGAYRDKFVLAFPYRNRQGLITGFVKRAIKQEGIEIDGNMARYDSTAGLSKYDLFNLHNCKGQEQIIIVEGYPEGLYFPTQGVSNITAIGAGLLSKTHIVGIKEFGIKSVILCLDNDEAGIANTQEALRLLSDNKINAVAIEHDKLVPYKDPDEYAKAKGMDKFLSLVTEAIKTTKQKEIPDQDTATIKFFKATDYGNAERLVHYHGDNLRYCEPLKSWLIWNGKRWKPDDSLEIIRLAKDVVRKIYIEAGHCENDEMRKAIDGHAKASESANKMKSMVEMTKSEISVVVNPDSLDKNGWLFNCQNGTVNLQTGLLQPFSKSDNLTKMSNVIFDPQAECPRWEQFMEEIFLADKDLIKFVKYALGYSLTNSIDEQCFFICYGEGENGKSKMQDTLRFMWGDYGQRVDASTFEDMKNTGQAREDIACLKQIRFITSIETGNEGRLAENLIKKMTGDSTIKARYLYQNSFEFEQTYKIWLATNHKPIISGTDTGIWRRVRLIPFEYKVPPDKKDGKLLEKLTAETSGIFNWILEGCLMWQSCGLDMATPPKVKNATENYRQDMDTLGNFIEECCLKGKNYSISVTKLHETYMAWANSRISRKSFNLKLEERGYKKARLATGFFWIGLGESDEIN